VRRVQANIPSPATSEEVNTPVRKLLHRSENNLLPGSGDDGLPSAERQTKTYSPFSHWDGFTSDSVDESWMAEFVDFTGNDSDDSNPDFELENEENIQLSACESLDMNLCRHFRMADVRIWSDYIRAKYDDDKWDQSRSTLFGDRSTFDGPEPSAKRRITQATEPPIHFFELFYNDVVIARLVAQTNTYAAQRSYRYPGKTNGRDGYDTCAIEMRAWLGCVILMGIKQFPTICDYWARVLSFSVLSFPKS